MKYRQKNILLIFLIAAAIAGFILLSPPVPQPHEYHSFADSRTILNINNAVNVLTNIAFILAGLAGIKWLLRSGNSPAGKNYRLPYTFFFSAAFLIGLGSSYYHYNPNNETLLWDRMPMTIAFMSLFSAVIAENINRKFGHYLLFPLIITGIASAIFWYITELKGEGDLRAYIIVQYIPVILIPVIVYLYDSNFTRSNDIYKAVFIYVIAKFFEIMDMKIFQSNGLISGHSIKHLLAALSIYIILRMLKKREPKTKNKLIQI